MSSAPYMNLEEDHISVDSAGSQGDTAKFTSQSTNSGKEYNVEVVGMEDFSTRGYSRVSVEGLKYSKKCMLSILFFVVVAVLLVLLVAVIARHSKLNEVDVESSFPWKDIRLPTDIKPDQYNIFLNPDLVKRTVEGNVSIVLHVTGTPNFIVIHAENMTLNDARLMSADDAGPQSIQVKTPLMSNDFAYFGLNKNLEDGGKYKLTMSFSYNLTEELTGFYVSTYQEDDVTKVIGSTQMEPIDAREAFPCFDEPQLKATFTLQIVHHASNNVVLFNTPKTKSEKFGKADSDLLLDTFETTVSMSTYLVGFVICEFSNMTAVTSGGTTVTVFSRREQEDQMSLALNAAKDIIPFYEDYFKIEYPLPKQDMVAIPNFEAGAMENWGLIMYRESALLYKDGVTRSMGKQFVVVVIAHELAHQWFGNLVTMKWWNDLWLNEGFASYMEYVGTDHFNADWKMMDQFIVETTHSALVQDALSYSHPISVEIKDPDEIGARFDSITYNKGASIIHMLSDYLTENVFKNGLRMYLKRHAYNNTETADLWDALTEASKNTSTGHEVDVKDLMDYWTLQMGYPVVNFKKVGTTIHVTQEQFLINPMGVPASEYKSKFNYKWKIPLTYTFSTGLDANEDGSILVDPDNDATINVPNDMVWIKGNSRQSGLYRVNYDTDNWKALCQVLLNNHMTMRPADRASVIDDAFHLFRSRRVEIEIPFNMIEYLNHERDYVPFATALDNLSYIRKVFQFHKIYTNFTMYMKIVLAPAMTELTMVDSGDHLKMLLRAKLVDFLIDIGHAETLEWATVNFEIYQTGNWSSVGVNLSPSMKCGGVKAGQKEDWDTVWEQFKNNTIASENNVLLRALTCTRDPAILTWLLYESLENRYIRSQDGISAIQYIFENPVGANIATHFVMENWKHLNEKYGSSLFALNRLLPSMASWISGKVQSMYVIAFLESKYDGATTSLQTLIMQAIEQLEINSGFVEWSEEKMENWLAEKLTKKKMEW